MGQLKQCHVRASMSVWCLCLYTPISSHVSPRGPNRSFPGSGSKKFGKFLEFSIFGVFLLLSRIQRRFFQKSRRWIFWRSKPLDWKTFSGRAIIWITFSHDFFESFCTDLIFKGNLDELSSHSMPIFFSKPINELEKGETQRPFRAIIHRRTTERRIIKRGT